MGLQNPGFIPRVFEEPIRSGLEKDLGRGPKGFLNWWKISPEKPFPKSKKEVLALVEKGGPYHFIQVTTSPPPFLKGEKPEAHKALGPDWRIGLKGGLFYPEIESAILKEEGFIGEY